MTTHPNFSQRAIEAGARAIARMIPCDGSHWNPGFGENFPSEYSTSEQKLIRAISERCISALAAEGFAVVPVEPTYEMSEAGIATLGSDDDRHPAQVVTECYAAMIRASQHGGDDAAPPPAGQKG